MKMTFPGNYFSPTRAKFIAIAGKLFMFFFPTEESGVDPALVKGETVVVVGASNKRGHLVVEHNNHNLLHVPFQFLELKPGPLAIQ